jgi:hypothetical protein
MNDFCQALQAALEHAPTNDVRDKVQALIDAHCHVRSFDDSGDNGPSPPHPPRLPGGDS